MSASIPLQCPSCNSARRMLDASCSTGVVVGPWMDIGCIAMDHTEEVAHPSLPILKLPNPSELEPSTLICLQCCL